MSSTYMAIYEFDNENEQFVVDVSVETSALLSVMSSLTCHTSSYYEYKSISCDLDKWNTEARPNIRLLGRSINCVTLSASAGGYPVD